jgi:hypothetical protein
MTEPVNGPLQTASRTSAARSAENVDAAQPAPGNGTGIERDRESPPGTPRWVKAFGIIAIVLILAFAGLHLTGNAPTHLPGSGGAEHGMQAP